LRTKGEFPTRKGKKEKVVGGGGAHHCYPLGGEEKGGDLWLLELQKRKGSPLCLSQKEERKRLIAAALEVKGRKTQRPRKKENSRGKREFLWFRRGRGRGIPVRKGGGVKVHTTVYPVGTGGKKEGGCVGGEKTKPPKKKKGRRKQEGSCLRPA